MENEVVLYKTKYLMGAMEQPYFSTVESRETYLESCSPFRVPLERPNIHLGYNLELDIILPIDYTIIQSYNFARIKYNSKEYFAYILDYQQVSVGYSKIELHRAVLFENINYLSLFKNFNIEQSTFLDDYKYNKNTKFYKPDFRFSRTKRSITNNIKLWALETKTPARPEVPVPYEIENIPCIVVFLSDFSKIQNSNMVNLYDYYGFPVQAGAMVIPIFPKGIVKNFGFWNYTSTENEPVISFHTFSFTFKPIKIISKYLEQFTPYMTSYQLINIPFGKTIIGNKEYLLAPFFLHNNDTIISNDVCIFNIQGWSPHYINNSFFYYELSDSFLSDYGEITYIFQSPDCSFTIDKSNFYTESGTNLFALFYLFLNPSDSSFIMKVRGQNNNAVVGKENNLITSLDLVAQSFYFVDTEANFNAQNRYYDAMTASVRNEKIIRGSLNAMQDIALGSVQYGSTPFMPAGGGQISSQVLGVSNIIRGIFKLGDTAADAVFYQQQRDIFRRNEKAKPDTFISGEDGVSRFLMSESFYAIEEIPFENDYQEWLSNIEIFGVPCSYFEASFDINSKLKNGNFFFKGVATLNDNSIIDSPSYNELYRIIKNGTVYNYM